MKDIIGIVLAAGKGSRMKASRAKILHQICGKPMVCYPIRSLKVLGPETIYVVVSYQKDKVKTVLSNEKVNLIEQNSLLGTADALKSVLNKVDVKKGSNLFILYGDFPLIKSSILEDMLKHHVNSLADCTFAVLKPDDITNFLDYGRVITDRDGNAIDILEPDELGKDSGKYKEINLGIYCIKYSSIFRDLLDKIKPSEKGEFYLTHIIRLLHDKALKVETFKLDSSCFLMGINTQADVAKANEIMRMDLVNQFMQQGVTFIDPKNTYLEDGVQIGKDSIIYPNTTIESGVKIGKACIIGPSSRLREATVLEDEVEIGNFVEIVRSRIGKGTKIKHFSYIGDAIIHEGVNIGAGTITANFDGKDKNQTIIEKNAFIGSGTILVAPVKVREAAVTGAGTVIPRGKDVAKNTTVVGVPAKVLNKNN